MLVLTAVLALAAGTLGGVVGFGSAVILLPLCSFLFGPRATVPVLTIAALLGNLSRAGVSRREIDWKAVGLYLSGALPGALAGSLFFVKIESSWLPALFGVFVIASVPARRRAKRNNLIVQAKHLPLLGASMGFFSAIVSTAGPINAPFFLSYGLVGGAYLATEALDAAGVHITKTLVYGRFQVAESRELSGICLLEEPPGQAFCFLPNPFRRDCIPRQGQYIATVRRRKGGASFLRIMWLPAWRSKT